ncbi:hypothetical protein SISNIDRAFT_489734 [Sistotremastrum niveocremeum HHB9708]|uniref:Uncharacterized protein n=2 Tax=Sistotremastraceae TaxID=3402574 RepID=A0A164PN21_9AGAM|nr:hypothetical protein SISNIDRAFT_489734 [Sistotremastrum niveocremeum HHB9708]KZT34445.1 hypothetical protein SISSUDRAFT_1065316 [Sistotremastrum suecicum HHB10207 ss-3]
MPRNLTFETTPVHLPSPLVIHAGFLKFFTMDCYEDLYGFGVIFDLEPQTKAMVYQTLDRSFLTGPKKHDHGESHSIVALSAIVAFLGILRLDSSELKALGVYEEVSRKGLINYAGQLFCICGKILDIPEYPRLVNPEESSHWLLATILMGPACIRTLPWAQRWFSHQLKKAQCAIAQPCCVFTRDTWQWGFYNAAFQILDIFNGPRKRVTQDSQRLRPRFTSLNLPGMLFAANARLAECRHKWFDELEPRLRRPDPIRLKIDLPRICESYVNRCWEEISAFSDVIDVGDPRPEIWVNANDIKQ